MSVSPQTAVATPEPLVFFPNLGKNSAFVDEHITFTGLGQMILRYFLFVEGVKKRNTQKCSCLTVMTDKHDTLMMEQKLG